MNACCQPVAIPAGQLDPAAWRRKQCQAQSFTDRAFSWAGSGRLGSQKASGSLFVARSPVSFSPSRLPATASTSPPTGLPPEGDALRGRNGATQNGIWNQLGAAD